MRAYLARVAVWFIGLSATVAIWGWTVYWPVILFGGFIVVTESLLDRYVPYA